MHDMNVTIGKLIYPDGIYLFIDVTLQSLLLTLKYFTQCLGVSIVSVEQVNVRLGSMCQTV